MNPAMNNAQYLYGQITAVSGKEVTFTTNLINPLDDESLKTRTAVINDNTKINVWKLKSADQAAKDRANAQAALASLQKQSDTLRATVGVCDQKRINAVIPMVVVDESADCKDARTQSDLIMKAMNDANAKMDMYQKIDNPSLSDIKAGWNITAVALAMKTSGSDKDPMLLVLQYENIASVQKFTASSIDVHEAFSSLPSLQAPVPAAPAAPAAAEKK